MRRTLWVVCAFLWLVNAGRFMWATFVGLPVTDSFLLFNGGLGCIALAVSCLDSAFTPTGEPQEAGR